jgi:hypothetical protein
VKINGKTNVLWSKKDTKFFTVSFFFSIIYSYIIYLQLYPQAQTPKIRRSYNVGYTASKEIGYDAGFKDGSKQAGSDSGSHTGSQNTGHGILVKRSLFEK